MTRDRTLPTDFLITRLAIKEGEVLRELPTDDSRAAPFDPVGRANWRDLVGGFAARMQSGDELWSWSNPKWAWDDMMGRAGLALVRNGEVIDHSLAFMN